MPTTPDTEHALRDWLRTRPVLTARSVAVHFGIPDAVPSNLITVGRVGGAPGSIWDEGRYSFACWGQTKKAASDTARDLAGLLTIDDPVLIGNGTKIMGATVDLMLWLPAPDTDRARYIVDVSAVALATT